MIVTPLGFPACKLDVAGDAENCRTRPLLLLHTLHTTIPSVFFPGKQPDKSIMGPKGVIVLVLAAICVEAVPFGSSGYDDVQNVHRGERGHRGQRGQHSRHVQQVISDAFDTEVFKCNLPSPESPDDGLPTANDLFSGKVALMKQVQRHSAIVRVPSISYDDGGDVYKDERYLIFFELHRVLEELFPSV